MQYIADFMELFQGLDRAYGVYDLSDVSIDQRGKNKGRAVTKHAPVTRELWQEHLEGGNTLGIVPIMDDDKCYFGAIDIDVYKGLDYIEILQKIQRFDMPLVPVKSKSGGLHLYCFVSPAVEAEIMQDQLRLMAAELGYANVEIFPKQTKINTEEGDVGGWINMPYNGDSRKAYNAQGIDFDPAQFVQFARIRRSRADLVNYKPAVTSDTEGMPPCLEALCKQGFPEGTRNEGLMSLGIYARLKDPDSWEDLLDEMNREFLDPPLSSSEVMSVVKSLQKTDTDGNYKYFYGCKKEPLQSFCMKGICRQRKFGIGESVESVEITSLTRLDTQPPKWFLDVSGGGRLTCTTDDLQDQRKFQRTCMNQLSRMPGTIKQVEWEKMINTLMQDMTVIEIPPEEKLLGSIHEGVVAYCHAGRRRTLEDAVQGGQAFYSEDEGGYLVQVRPMYLYLKNRHKLGNDIDMPLVTQVVSQDFGGREIRRTIGTGHTCLFRLITAIDPPKNHKPTVPEMGGVM